MNDNKRDQIQRTLVGGDLCRAVEDAADALRSRGGCDLLDRNGLRFALLCWALERSAGPTGVPGWPQNITLHGALRALNDITKG